VEFYVELVVFGIQKFDSPLLNDGDSNTNHPFFIHFKLFLVSSALHAYVIELLLPSALNEGGVLQNCLKKLPAVSINSLL
jgi:hypothetical protein